MPDHITVFAVLLATLVLFVVERWRYDVVALIALLTLTVIGIVPHEASFRGFAHPAVVTVAAILVVSQGLTNSGLVLRISGLLSRVGSNVTVQIAALVTVVSVCSAFMNNVGALALLMPVAVRMAVQTKISPSLLLMPLAFGSLLGGMTTLIGTPPNIIIGTLRSETGAEPFGMFAFSKVGISVAIVGLIFISLIGWRLIPRRLGRADAAEMFHIEQYTTELRVPEASSFAGKRLREISAAREADFVVVAIVRGKRKILSPTGTSRVRAGDHLIVELEPGSLGELVETTGFELVGERELGEAALRSDEISLFEAVVVPRSPLQGKTVQEAQLRALHGLNLLAVARQGERIIRRLKAIRFQPGDVLLMQGQAQRLTEALSRLGCLPLAPRPIDLGQPRRLLTALGVFGLALGALVSGVLPAATAFAVAALAMVLLRIVTLQEAYRSIDWPVIILLGAMIPVGGALESSGGAALIATRLAELASRVPVPLTLALVLILAMFLSDVMNNAATAVIMAPIAIRVATSLEVSPDPFLMAVAVGASCAFLTPIGHQSNTLVMGPGGYRFGDYWRLGLPLEILIVVLGVPAILWAWPLHP